MTKILEETYTSIGQLMEGVKAHENDLELPSELEVWSIIESLPLEDLNDQEKSFVWQVGWKFICTWMKRRNESVPINEMLARVANKIDPFKPQQ